MDQPTEASGWGVLHDRSLTNDGDGPNLYMFGPLPTWEIAQFMRDQMTCPCVTTVIPLFFPPGTHMVVAIPDIPEPDPGLLN